MTQAERDELGQRPVTIEEIHHIAEYPKGQREEENFYPLGKTSFWDSVVPFLIIAVGLIVAIALEANGR